MILAFASCTLVHAPSHFPLQAGNGLLPLSGHGQGQPGNKAKLGHSLCRFTVAVGLLIY